MGQFGVGQAVRRKEDLRLLTGGGRYLDDINVPGQAYAYILRSPHAHAKILSIDTAEAKKSAGVVAILTGKDVLADKLGGVPCLAKMPSKDGKAMVDPGRPLLVADRVRFVGDYVALVIAETYKQAKDAAEQIVVDYAVLPAIIDTAKANKPGAPAVWDQAPDNRVFHWHNGDEQKTKDAFAKAAKVVKLDLVNQRVVVASMEPRGALGQYDTATGRYTIHTPCQNVHMIQRLMAGCLNDKTENVRIVSPDVGGGFGMKVFAYAEQALMPWAAKKVGRAVKWTSDRSEAFLSDTQGRDHVTHAELAIDKDGKFLAVKVSNISNMGAYLSNFAPAVATQAGTGMMVGVYDIPAAYVEVLGVFTNTTFIDAYRGAGRPEASHVIERLVDIAAMELGISPIELRRRNFIKPAQMPYKTQLGHNYDSGDFFKTLDAGLKFADWDSFPQRKAEAAARGKLRGIGLAYYVECAAGGDEHAEIKFEGGGKVTLLVGTLTNGQGHATSYAQVLEDLLGVPFGDITLVQGDTDRIPNGNGTGGSKSMMLGASVIKKAADKIVEKGKKIAAHMLEAAETDIEFADGTFRIAGTDRKLSIAEIAAKSKDKANLPEGMEPGLDTRDKSDVHAGTYPNGAHVCEVEIDPETGVTEVVSYAVMDDFGKVVNPLLIAGQVHGGLAQGIGQVLLEHCIYDNETGQLLTGSYMDYAMPKADSMPSFKLAFNNVPCTTNPFGIKGAGEAGTVGALGCVVNGIVDAVKHLGIKHVEMPATPERMWRLINGASRKVA